ncbi:AAA family ATPase [Methanococcoides sp. SA1]|nr:AAA family ATPase [Methanococcoides sp. SA1]
MKLTLSGLPGAGKGQLIERLSAHYGIPSFSVGDLRRSYAAELGLTIQAFNELGKTDPTTDTKADEYQKQWASKKPSFILEGRLSHIMLKETDPKIVSLFLTATEEERARRIFNAQRESETMVASVAEQMKTNHQRCQSDIKRYNQIYGIKDCYNPQAFDIIIDSTHTNETQTALKTINTLETFLRN